MADELVPGAEPDAPQKDGVQAPQAGWHVHWFPGRLEHLDILGDHEVVPYPLSLIGNLPHGVVQVPVKAGKEPEAVLGWAAVLQEETASLATDYSTALIDIYLEAA